MKFCVPSIFKLKYKTECTNIWNLQFSNKTGAQSVFIRILVRIVSKEGKSKTASMKLVFTSEVVGIES